MSGKAKTESIRCTVNPQLKHEVEQILFDCGLSVASAVRVFFEQVAKHRGLPFEVRSKTQEDISYDEFLRRRVEIGLAQIKEGKVIPNEVVLAKLAAMREKWQDETC